MLPPAALNPPPCCGFSRLRAGLLLAVALAWPTATQAQPLETNLLSLNASWRYNHTNCFSDASWTATNYDDSNLNNWTNAPGGFTGGETRPEALLGVTTSTLPAPNNGTRAGRAMYFRTRFNVNSTANLSLVFSNRIDDNAVFHLNGQLVQRLRFTPSPILCGSFGDANPYANSDAVEWDVFTLSPAQLAGILVAGTNTLAVEVHQSGNTSTDMVFALSLTGSLPDTNPPPTLRMPPEPPSYGYSVGNGFSGLTFGQPVAFATPPGETNRLFVVNQAGTIYVITNLANPTRTTFMDLSAQVMNSGESGLLGLAFHPGYATNRYFFVFYSTTATTTQGANSLHQRLARFQTDAANPNSAPTNSQMPLITQADPASNHNGADVHFGPDGLLYVSLGDGGIQNDGSRNSQIITSNFFSAIMRLDVDVPFRASSVMPNPHPANTNNPGAAINYRIPFDNPFIGATNFDGRAINSNQVRTEFYAVGFRNPWRFSFDPETGFLYCGDVGQNTWEEVDIVTRGGNYGWAYLEGLHAGYRATNTVVGPFIPPIQEYQHGSATNQGSSVTGGIVYRGTRIPQLTGWYVFADYASGNIWRLRYDGTNTIPFQRIAGQTGLSAFGADPSNGDVLMANVANGTVHRLIQNTNSTLGTPLPPTLADTGAFTNLTALPSQTATLTANTGMTPYDINVHFWSDNARKSRWFFLPGTNKFTFSPNANWSFPTGAAWVKHFDLELTNGVPSSARRLETRILVKNTNGVYGVTYRWGSSLTNATLVGEDGLDEAFTVYDGGLARTQIWHYPSRSECLTCHTPVGGHALGFNTAQLNRDFDTGSGLTNQLEAMSRAGYFTSSIGNLHAHRSLAPAAAETASLEWRVRSYLAANCVQCHVPGGLGLGSWSAALTNTTANSGLIHGALANNGGNPAARVVVPGSPADSMLLSRISTRGSGQMPPLGSSVLDAQAIALVSRWITNGLAGYQTFAQWQTNHFGSTNAPGSLAASDPDQDGATNFEEFLTGTDPNQPGSFWALGIQRAGGAVDLTWSRIPNRSVEIQSTTNLSNPASWQFLELPANRPYYPASTGSGGVTASTTNEAGRFFRGRVTEP